MITARLSEDYIYVRGKFLPKNTTREELELLGARYLKTENFKVNGTEKNIEYMVIKQDYMAVWKKTSPEENYTLHLFAPNVVKFP